MRRLVTALALAMPLFMFSLYVAESPALAAESMAASGEHSHAPLVKCSTCGVEFTTINELREHMKAHPDHKLMPLAVGGAHQLVKCSTCGVEFTTIKESEMHVKSHPEHKLVSEAAGDAIPLIKCSTCGVEFTTLPAIKTHMKEHPEHKLMPME